MTIELTLYATILLIFRLISMMFIYRVLKRQWSLFKLPVQAEDFLGSKRMRHFRNVLFMLALIIFFGNVLPAVIDLIAIFGDGGGRPEHVPMISFSYTLSSSLTALASSYLIWRLYELADDSGKASAPTIKTLEDSK